MNVNFGNKQAFSSPEKTTNFKKYDS